MRKPNFSLAIIWFSVLLIAGCASGSAIVTGTTRDPIDPSQVKLYLEAPEQEYEAIALVKASSDWGWTAQGSTDYAIDELKNQAAKLGANGILITGTGENTSTSVGGYGSGVVITTTSTEQVVSGMAIYVYKQ